MGLRLVTVEPKPLDMFELKKRKYLSDNECLGPCILEPPDYNPAPVDDTNYALLPCGCVFTLPADDFAFYWQQCKIHQVEVS